MLKLTKLTSNFDYSEVYFRMYRNWFNKISNAKDLTSFDKMKSAYLTVMMVNSMKGERSSDPEYWLKLYEDAMQTLSELTPRQFVNTFPPEKRYDSDHFDDYYSTMEVVNSFLQDEPIEYGIDDILYNYRNIDIDALLNGYVTALNACPDWEGERTELQEYLTVWEY